MPAARIQSFALMALAYAVGLIVLLIWGSAETTFAFALVLGLLLAYYAQAWFLRRR